MNISAPALIRLMTPADYSAAHALWTATPGMGLHSEDDSPEGITRYLQRNPESCFVAERSGRLVGTVLAGHDGRRGFIYHLAVAPDAQRRGIADALVNAALQALRVQQIQKVALLIYRDNHNGNAFWDKRRFSRREDVYYRDQWLEPDKFHTDNQ